MQSGWVKLHVGILKDNKRRVREKGISWQKNNICKLRATLLSQGNYKPFSIMGTGLASYRSYVSEQIA